MHSPVELFARFAQSFVETVYAGGSFTLEDRVQAVTTGLGNVVAAGIALPVVAGRAPAPGPGPVEDWPGLGSFESYWHHGEDGPIPLAASDTLLFVTQQIWAGLERYDAGDVERAAGLWGAGYETTWGPAAVELLAVLHQAVVGYRTDQRQAIRGPRSRMAPLVTLSAEPPPPTGRPTLGVQIQPVQGGLEVLAVHPRGPAAGVLQIHDVILGVDGRSLDGDGVGGADLAGPVGEVRRYEVYRGGETVVLSLGSVDLQELA